MNKRLESKNQLGILVATCSKKNYKEVCLDHSPLSISNILNPPCVIHLSFLLIRKVAGIKVGRRQVHSL